MASSNQSISYEIIEEGVLKTFARKKHPKIADILKDIDIEKYFPKEYRTIYYSFSSLLKLILFMMLKHIRFQSQLERYFKKCKSERKKLGLPRTPDQTQISYFRNKILNDDERERLKSIVVIIEAIAKKKGVVLDTIELQPERPQKSTGPRNQQLRIKREVGEINKEFRQKFQPEFETFLKTEPHGQYGIREVINIPLQMIGTNDFAENASKTIRDQLQHMIVLCPKCRSQLNPLSNWVDEDKADNVFICKHCGYERKIVPTGDTYRKKIKKRKRDEIERFFERQYERLFEMQKQHSKGREYPKVYALDNTEIPYYGDKDTEMIRGVKRTKSAKYCNKYMALDCVQPGERFTVDMRPYGPFDDKHKLINNILDNARRRNIKISLLVLDRAFFDSETIMILNNRKIRFIMPCTEYADIKKLLESAPMPYVENNRLRKGRGLYNMVPKNALDKEGQQILDEDGKPVKHAFATNILLDENDKQGTWKMISGQYRQRWGIETSFRMKKRSFGLWTTSKNYRIRIFNWLLSVMMYNLWILADMLTWLELFGIIGDYHKVTSKRFRNLFFLVDPG
jgi:hypothetical protein